VDPTFAQRHPGRLFSQSLECINRIGAFQ
jgi:hypothetical protein